jgi:hypothetical protein
MSEGDTFAPHTPHKPYPTPQSLFAILPVGSTEPWVFYSPIDLHRRDVLQRENSAQLVAVSCSGPGQA